MSSKERFYVQRAPSPSGCIFPTFVVSVRSFRIFLELATCRLLQSPHSSSPKAKLPSFCRSCWPLVLGRLGISGRPCSEEERVARKRFSAPLRAFPAPQGLRGARTPSAFCDHKLPRQGTSKGNLAAGPFPIHKSEPSRSPLHRNQGGLRCRCHPLPASGFRHERKRQPMHQQKRADERCVLKLSSGRQVRTGGQECHHTAFTSSVFQGRSHMAHMTERRVWRICSQHGIVLMTTKDLPMTGLLEETGSRSPMWEARHPTSVSAHQEHSEKLIVLSHKMHPQNELQLCLLRVAGARTE